MPRKAFVADLKEAVESSSADNIFDLKAGDEDGSFTFEHRLSAGASPSVTVQALISDVADYPSAHQYIVYTTSENVPKSINEALTDSSIFEGLKVSPMLDKAAKALNKATAGSRHNPVRLEDDAMDIDSPPEPEDSELEEEEEEDAADSEGEWSPRPPQHTSMGGHFSHHGNAATSILNERIRADLRYAKKAGFRVSHLGNLSQNARDCFITVSCRIAKLGISDEAIQAWHLDRKQYITLLIHFTAGYRILDSLTAEEPSRSRSIVEMRIGVSSRYKVSHSAAIEAFSKIKDKDRRKTEVKPECPEAQKDKKADAKVEETEEASSEGLHSLFIGRPLDELLNERLLPVLRYRVAMGMPWSGAEDYYNDNQGRNIIGSDTMNDKYWAEDRSNLSGNLPTLVTADHLAEASKDQSFPLLAMQFALRHLVRCTEFCLVCHCRIEADFEALKPYVCSKPLCLYQYMSLGFGPSIEYEVLSQPYVVDLLVSFCYSSAQAGRLSSLPLGMGLTVPSPSLIAGRAIPLPSARSYMPPAWTDGIAPQKSSPGLDLHSSKKHKARLDEYRSELLFPPGEKPLKTGDWIYLAIPGKRVERLHCRVIETFYPNVRLGPPIIPPPSVLDSEQQLYPTLVVGVARSQALTPAATPPPPTHIDPSSYPEVDFVVYDKNFDDLSDPEKQSSICMLLETLPSVSKMKEFLHGIRGKHMSFRNWPDRISPAALGVLRWIIASNRSCIIQIDNLDGESRHSGDRVSGMQSWMQFRFAMGAPDKEQRFVTAVRETAGRLALKYPTFFAWHGSPLHNWHGIIREGLHFKETLHGRAFGDGVYHSLDASTSLGYTGSYAHYSSFNDSSPGWTGWPHSELKVSSAMSLNEIVNAPAEFRNKQPHLVVAQLDWIQTRYLFVKCNVPEKSLVDKVPLQALDQDPSYTPRGPAHESIVIPITAVSKSRRSTSKSVKSGNKKAKVELPANVEEELLLSDETDVEDLAIFFSETEETSKSSQTKSKGHAVEGLVGNKKARSEGLKTDFVPGTLDHSTLPLLAPPSYATSMATKTLQRELKATLKVQDAHPTEELGWYLDRELINNVYQWIIELHSFEDQLPLAREMKAKGLKSIVLEIRFGSEYPMSPPFVRVIRPRFLPFMLGGGGHVTGGGALCMELLTNSGWSSVSSIESVLLQVRMAISSTDPKPARLENGPVRDYGVGEAVEAYKRACIAHGWQIPKDFDTFNAGAGGSF